MIQVSWVIFIVQLVSSFMMIGIAWLVQMINYPMFRNVPDVLFKEYHRTHLSRSQWVIGPLMLVEMVSAAYLLIWPIVQVKYALYVLNFFLIILIWLLTFIMHLPAHRNLQEKHSLDAIDKLINWNWIRTIIWSLHGFVLIFILY